MRVVCKFISGAAIEPALRHLGESNETDYSPLKMEKEYFVYSLLLIKNRIDYLVAPENELPFWAPSVLFELIDGRLPNNWSMRITSTASDYKILNDSFGITSIIGYSSLTQDFKHYTGLIERDPFELRKFYGEIKQLYSQD